jgi:ribosomal-protein-alanine N-acetyltransferase
MITLRNYTHSDVNRIVELANNENVSRYLVFTFPYPYTRKDAEWWIETGAAANDCVTKAIEYEGVFVGTIGITPQSGWRSHIAEIGYWVGQPYWGKGIATTSLGIMSKIAVEELGFKKLFAPVLAPNRSSMRVLEKAGYHLEGVLKNEVEKNGRYYDIHHYAKTCL